MQRQCLGYAAKEGQVICAEPPPYGGETPPLTVAAQDPGCLRQLVSEVWGAQAATWDAARGPVLFLHERRSKAGVRRLVIVRRTPPVARMSWDIPMAFNVTLFEPGGLTGSPRRILSYLPDAVPSHFGDGSGGGPRLRLFAGRLDPADESHFTIDYELNGDRGTIDGWLRDTQEEPWPVRVELGQR
jgi:hypothetical protein